VNRPVPSHHGHLTACGVPPSVEITLPVPRQGLQRWGSYSGSGLKAGGGYPMPGGATEVAARFALSTSCCERGRSLDGYESSRCTVSGENAGRHTARYDAPPASGVE
jgi:hypothetical protein